MESTPWDERRSLKKNVPIIVLFFLGALAAFWLLTQFQYKFEPPVTKSDTDDVMKRFSIILPSNISNFKLHYRHALVESYIFSFDLPVEAELSNVLDEMQKKVVKSGWTFKEKADNTTIYSKTDTLITEKTNLSFLEMKIFTTRYNTIWVSILNMPEDGDYSLFKKNFEKKFKELSGQ
ncbi:MAG: hypothetical protein JXA60_06655 [Candidatus Coatesbacteria bacterium]|nr:hypothetical protein [Candidatus Coatesbacteria bacterium]